jgi:outer membrane protein assembly factor BamA
MNKTSLLYILFLAGIALLSFSCSNTRFLTGDQLLYTGKKTVFISDSGKFTDFRAKQITESVTGFKPNNSIAGKRVLPPVGLWVYNYWKKDPGKKKGWLYRTLSKEPVLVSVVNPGARARKLESDLFSVGYFHSEVRMEIDTSSKNPRKARVTYFIKSGKPFRYNNITFAPPEEGVDSVIHRGQDKLGFKKGDVFNLDLVKEESKKITDRALEEGYFYFNQSNISYTADTTNLPSAINLRIGKNNELIQNGRKKYFIGSITVKIINETDTAYSRQQYDTIIADGVKIISKGSPFNPEVITRCIYFREGDRYAASKQRQTTIHLNSYGIFKFINVRYTPDRDTLVNKLDVMFELTPAKDISLDLEANVVTKSTGFTGPGFVATLAQGNLWKGANKLQLKLNGGFEWQWSPGASSSLGTFSYNAGISTSITFPKLIAPGLVINKNRFNLPQTTVTLGFEFLNKTQYYRMSSVNLGFGYRWKKPDKITHTYYPLFVNSIALLKTTEYFDSIMNANPYIRKSFEEQFIVGMKYDFTYDNSFLKRTNGFYLATGVSTSGNLLDLLNMAFSDETERPYSIGQNVYSQFLKLTADIRYYRNFRKNSLAFRLYSGVGLPYSNSVVMPYVEQFYSGGSNSIRAFEARTVGPGTVIPPVKTDTTDVIVDQTGDIRLEGNIEFRFKLSKVMQGALFVDAGNIWLLRPDSTRAGAEFHFNTFADQLAVGTGFGLRFDFDFFVLRLDLGFPLRYPYLKDGSNWVTSWNAFFEKPVLSFAIGYPF